MRKRKLPIKDADDMKAEYDFSKMKGVRGKYYERYMAGTNLVLIQPDVYAEFRSGEAVNEALRTLIRNKRRRRAANRAKSGRGTKVQR